MISFFFKVFNLIISGKIIFINKIRITGSRVTMWTHSLGGSHSSTIAAQWKEKIKNSRFGQGLMKFVE